MEKKEKKEKIFDSVTDIGSDVAGDAIGAVVGTVVAGPGGTVLGSIAGGLLSNAFKSIGAEVKKRYLSPREEVRIETVLQLAQKKIEENIEKGKIIRDDDYFDDNESERSSAKEILEGVLVHAQKEYEEKKLPYMANLYANIAFDQEIGRADADRLIKVASDLTYRELQIISQIGRFQLAKGQIPDPRYNKRYSTIEGRRNIAIASEIYRLYRNTILTDNSALLGLADINPSTLELIGIGADLFNLMELAQMPLDQNTGDILSFLCKARKAPNQD